MDWYRATTKVRFWSCGGWWGVAFEAGLRRVNTSELLVLGRNWDSPTWLLCGWLLRSQRKRDLMVRESLGLDNIIYTLCLALVSCVLFLNC
jgi:hypothetical protein